MTRYVATDCCGSVRPEVETLRGDLHFAHKCDACMYLDGRPHDIHVTCKGPCPTDALKEHTVSTENDHIAGAVMAALVGQIDENGESIADRISVADLWSVLNITIPVVMQTLVEEARTKGAITLPRGMSRTLTPEERKVAADPNVRKAITNGQKIVAIKEARMLTGLGLKESKDIVESMEDYYKKTGTWFV